MNGEGMAPQVHVKSLHNEYIFLHNEYINTWRAGTRNIHTMNT